MPVFDPSDEPKCLYTDNHKWKEYRHNAVWFHLLKTIHPEKGRKLDDAVRCSLNQKREFIAFLDFGDVPISYNLTENAIRRFKVGRKN